jgi:purine-binding chemotaxis protein CheW
VSQVIDFSANDILPAPPFGTHVRIEFLRGMGKAGSKFVLVLDIAKVLSGSEMQPGTAPRAVPLETSANKETSGAHNSAVGS